MGALVEWDDVTNKYRDAGSSGDATTMDAAYIAPAEAYIAGYLSGRFSSILSSGSELVRDLVVDETYRRLVLLKQPKRADVLGKDIQRRLKDLLSGRVSMLDTDGAVVMPDKTVLWSDTQNYTPVFGMGNVLDFEVDQDQLDDEEDARG